MPTQNNALKYPGDAASMPRESAGEGKVYIPPWQWPSRQLNALRTRVRSTRTHPNAQSQSEKNNNHNHPPAAQQPTQGIQPRPTKENPPMRTKQNHEASTNGERAKHHKRAKKATQNPKEVEDNPHKHADMITGTPPQKSNINKSSHRQQTDRNHPGATRQQPPATSHQQDKQYQHQNSHRGAGHQ